MDLPLAALIPWAAGVFLELLVFIQALRRRLFERLPLFVVYLGLLLASDLTAWIVYASTGINSFAPFFTYRLLQAILLLSRAFVVYDICRLLLSPYRGIWTLCRPALASVAALLLIGAFFETRDLSHRVGAIIFTADWGLELVVVSVLILGLAFCRYYRIRVDRYLIWIALGLGFYSLVQIVNNTSVGTWLIGTFATWRALRIVSFNLTTILWLVALRKPLPAPPVALDPWDQERYREWAPVVSQRLRELNARLLGIRK